MFWLIDRVSDRELKKWAKEVWGKKTLALDECKQTEGELE